MLSSRACICAKSIQTRVTERDGEACHGCHSLEKQASIDAIVATSQEQLQASDMADIVHGRRVVDDISCEAVVLIVLETLLCSPQKDSEPSID